jgi:hypothetical protein
MTTMIARDASPIVMFTPSRRCANRCNKPRGFRHTANVRGVTDLPVIFRADKLRKRRQLSDVPGWHTEICVVNVIVSELT